MGGMRAPSNGIEIEYETFGDAERPAAAAGDGPRRPDDRVGRRVLRRAWSTAGFFVIRFDNRDVGLSTKIDVGDLDPMTEIMKALLGRRRRRRPTTWPTWPTTRSACSTHLGIDRAHVVGASMGGMIAQTIAIAHPERVLSLTSIMSTTGDPDVGQPDPEVAAAAARGRRPTEREAYIANAVARQPSCIGSPEHFDEDRAAEPRPALAFDRCFYPAGMGHQLLAIVVVAEPVRRPAPARRQRAGHPRRRRPAGQRQRRRAHGRGHPRRRAAACSRAWATTCPPYYWPQVIEAITALASRSAARPDAAALATRVARPRTTHTE